MESDTPVGLDCLRHFKTGGAIVNILGAYWAVPYCRLVSFRQSVPPLRADELHCARNMRVWSHFGIRVCHLKARVGDGI